MFRSTFKACVIWLCLFAAVTGRTDAAEPLAYRPSVGQTYAYGVELSVRGKDSTAQVFTNRCRIEYVVTKSDSDGWEATYTTVPFRGLIRSGTKESLHASIQRSRDAIARGPVVTNTTIPAALPQSVRDRISTSRTSDAKIRWAMAKQRVSDFENNPGLRDYCDGVIRVLPSGEVGSVRGRGSLPLLVGHIAKLPLMRLPTAAESSVSFRDTFNFILVSSTDDTEQRTEGATLNVIRKDTELSGDLTRFRREIELAGGGTAGKSLTASGSGIADFSTQLSMPYRGNVNYSCTGFGYPYLKGDLKLRVGFHHLNQIRGEFFDAGLSAADNALSPEVMPRATLKQQKELLKRFLEGNPIQNLDAANFAKTIAPPAFNSKLQRELTEAIEQNKRDTAANRARAKAIAAGELPANTPRQTSTPPWKQMNINGAEPILRRWAKIRRMALTYPRTWSDASGSFEVTATLVSADAAQISIRRIDNGQVITVPRDRLSETDIEFATTFGVPSSSDPE